MGISKFTTEETLRLKALESYSIMDSLPEIDFDYFTQLAAIICETPICLISLLDSERQWFKSKVGLSVNETPRNISFCQYTILGPDIYEVVDASNNELFKDNPLVTSDPSIRFYAGAPLIDREGFNLGSLCVIDTSPKTLTNQQKTSLKLLADSIVSLLESKREIKKLKENEHDLSKRISYILDATGDGVWDWSPITGKTIYSKRWAEMLGFNIEDLSDSDKEWSSRVHPSDLEFVNNEIGKNISGESDSFTLEYRFKNKNGQYLTMLNRGRVVERELDGKATRVIGSHTDLSEKRNKDLANQIVINNLQNFFDLSVDSLCIANLDGTFKEVNDTFMRELGYKKEEFIGAPFKKFIHEDDLINTSLEVDKLSKGTLTIDFENRYKRKDGTYLCLSWRVTPDISTGNLFCSARNISTQKLNLKQIEDLKLALDESSIVAMTDHGGIITFANDKFCEISKFSREELIDQNHQIVNSGYHSKAYIKRIWVTIAHGKTWKGDIKNKAKDGSYYWVNTTILPFLDDQGMPYQYISVSNDITNQKNAENDLIHAKEVAELSVRSKEQFLANMSHEIRTPMNGIIGFSKILEEEITDPLHKEYLNSIKSSGENLMVLINDILDFSKIESNKMEIEKTVFSIYKTVETVISLLAPKCKEKGIKLISENIHTFPENLIGDPTRLGQILINLIVNAVKFTEKGSVELRIEKINETPKDIKLKFTIIDTGIGIPSNKLETIFESFTQASNETTRKFGGTGLGLTITKRLIELQGGELCVKSEDGEGSEFSFIISYLKSIVQPKISTMSIENKKTDTSFLEGKKILMVEDNPLNQQLGFHIFKRWGYEVDIADNGQIAIDKLKNGVYDLILMDIQMPVMDGNDATKYIRENLGEKSAIPIIALTAHATLGEEQRCLDNGMDDYLSKPFDSQKLLEKIHTNLFKNEKKPILIIEEPQYLNTNPDIFDFTYLYEVADNDEEFVQEMIQLFLTNVPISIEQIILSIDNDEKANLKNELHKLKSSLGLLGLDEGFTIAKMLEDELISGKSIMDIHIKVYSLIHICQIAINQLAKMKVH